MEARSNPFTLAIRTMRRTLPLRAFWHVFGRWAVLTLPLAACEVMELRSSGREGAAGRSAVAIASEHELDEVVVRLPALSDSAVRLSDGSSDDPVRRRYVLRVAGFDAHGDFDGDGDGERAVLVTANTGGSRVFVNVVAFGDDAGVPRQEAVLQLGDRVHLHRFESVDDALLIEVAEHGPVDAMCCPTQRIVRHYRIEDAAWVEIGNQT